jgi:ATP/maltotriose-dependent transcriptional regulator MalT
VLVVVVAPSGFVTTGLPGRWATMTDAQVAWLCCDGTGGEPAQFWSRLTSRLTARSWRGMLPRKPPASDAAG